ncbi:MAG: class I adenylate-forming enzyme family protein, partial [Candidatus Binatia bacterium]
TLWERAVEVARALLACGISKDSRVGVMMTNRPEWISGVFGVGLAGGVAVAINTFSTGPELENLLEASGVSILLFERHVAKKDFAEVLYESEPALRTAKPGELASTKFPFLRRLAAVGEAPAAGAIESWSAFLARGSHIPSRLVDATAATVKPSDTGLLFFSSGTTDKPKGILHAHRAAAIQLWRSRRLFALGDDARCWTPNGFFWVGNSVMAVGATFSAGGALVLQHTFDPVEALELMQTERVTYPRAWPHQWAQLEAAPNWSKVDLRSFRYVDPRYAGARHPTVSPPKWLEPRWSYGSTEAFAIFTSYPSGTPPEVAGESFGEPLPGNTVKIVDRNSGAVVPRGERGEIVVKGPTMMQGYIGRLREETFDEEGFFHSGDVGHIDERGRLFFEGRRTAMIKTGGANVSPVEVDIALASYPGIKVAKTVGVPHETLGEMVVACIVPQEGTVIEEAAIRDFLKQRLSSYKVPRRVLFFRDEEIALNAIKSTALRDLVAERLSAGAAEASRRTGK